MLMLILILFLKISYSSTLTNCRSYSGYIFKYFTQDCIETPDFGKNIVDIFRYYNVPYEIHEVTTDDGYILTVFRLPQKHPKGTVLLQHPLTTDAIVWVFQPENPTAILFWRAGYDVWLPNNRGTYFSNKHRDLTVDNPKYWNFTFHEIGYYDHSNVIRFIKNITKKKIFFVGHSMSTTTGLIYSSLRNEEAVDSIELMILLAPAIFLQKSTASIFYFIKSITYFLPVLNYFGSYTLFKYDSLFHQSLIDFLTRLPFKYLITAVICATHGWTPHHIDPLVINHFLTMVPSEFPWKILAHFKQLTTGSQDEFLMYDHGPEINQKLYKSSRPKVYPLESIQVPTYIVHGDQDIISSIEGPEMLYQRLNETARYGKKQLKDMGHVDFQLGRFRIEKVYKPVLRIIKRKLKENRIG